MLERFFPDFMFESVHAIPFKDLYEKGYRGLIFDIDNTLVPEDAPATRDVIAFANDLKLLGFQCLLLSNNSQERIIPFAMSVGMPFVSKAMKPFKKGYRKAIQKMNLPSSQILVVGDQIFTDIWGANRVGLTTILVPAINPVHEKLTVRIKRLFEPFVMKRYLKKSKKGI